MRLAVMLEPQFGLTYDEQLGVARDAGARRSRAGDLDAGPRRTPRLAARYAEEWNTMLATPDDCAARRAALDEACAAEGRDPIPLARVAEIGLAGTPDAVLPRLQA